MYKSCQPSISSGRVGSGLPASRVAMTSSAFNLRSRLSIGVRIWATLGCWVPSWWHCQLEQSEGDFRRFASAIHQVACDV